MSATTYTYTDTPELMHTTARATLGRRVTAGGLMCYHGLLRNRGPRRATVPAGTLGSIRGTGRARR